MPRKMQWEYPSLVWIHQVREADYQRTKGLPVKKWLPSQNVEKVAKAGRVLGLRVRLPHTPKRKTA